MARNTTVKEAGPKVQHTGRTSRKQAATATVAAIDLDDALHALDIATDSDSIKAASLTLVAAREQVQRRGFRDQLTIMTKVGRAMERVWKVEREDDSEEATFANITRTLRDGGPKSKSVADGGTWCGMAKSTCRTWFDAHRFASDARITRYEREQEKAGKEATNVKACVAACRKAAGTPTSGRGAQGSKEGAAKLVVTKEARDTARTAMVQLLASTPDAPIVQVQRATEQGVPTAAEVDTWQLATCNAIILMVEARRSLIANPAESDAVVPPVLDTTARAGADAAVTEAADFEAFKAWKAAQSA